MTWLVCPCMTIDAGAAFSIDVVVPTYNGWELTRTCLEHLQLQTAQHSVIVVDNASTDGTPERVRRSFSHVQVIVRAANDGFAVACNAGARAGGGDVIVLLNNDVECRPDFLERLVAPLRENEHIGSVAAVLVKPDRTIIDSVGLTADRTLSGFPRLWGHAVADVGFASPVLAGPAGAAGAYRRVAWEQAEGLDERVFMYGEDLDLALRLRAAGWQTAVAGDAVAVHLGHRRASATVRGGSATTEVRARVLPAALRGAEEQGRRTDGRHRGDRRPRRRTRLARLRCGSGPDCRLAFGGWARSAHDAASRGDRPRAHTRRESPTSPPSPHTVTIGSAESELRCPACDAQIEAGASLHGVDRLHRTAGEHDVRCCTACGTGVTLPLVTPSQLAAFYPGDYGPYEDSHGVLTGAISHAIHWWQGQRELTTLRACRPDAPSTSDAGAAISPASSSSAVGG